jgi:hypothetical protein
MGEGIMKRYVRGIKNIPYSMVENERGFFTAMAGSIPVYYASMVSGIPTAVHELGHALVGKLLYNDYNPKIEVDSFENMSNFLKKPSLESFSKILSFNDVRNDGSLGHISGADTTKINDVGKAIGESNAYGLYEMAGYAFEEMLVPAIFLLGYKIRKKNPLAGYSLMGSSMVKQIEILIPAAKAALSDNIRYEAIHNEIAKFSLDTGISPWVPLGLLAGAIPATVAGIHLYKRGRERKAEKERKIDYAESLIGEEKIDWKREFEGYRNRDSILDLNEKIEQEERTSKNPLKKLRNYINKRKFNGEVRDFYVSMANRYSESAGDTSLEENVQLEAKGVI